MQMVMMAYPMTSEGCLGFLCLFFGSQWSPQSLQQCGSRSPNLVTNAWINVNVLQKRNHLGRPVPVGKSKTKHRLVPHVDLFECLSVAHPLPQKLDSKELS